MSGLYTTPGGRGVAHAGVKADRSRKSLLLAEYSKALFLLYNIKTYDGLDGRQNVDCLGKSYS